MPGSPTSWRSTPRATIFSRPHASWCWRKRGEGMPEKFNTALIVGAGSGLSASLARALAKDGIRVALAARTPGDLDGLVKETGAKTYACDASQRGVVEKLFADLERDGLTPDI